MSQATDPQYLSLVWLILKWLLGASFVSWLMFLVTIHKLLPNLSIERIIDKHSRLALESRLLIKNMGMLPAYNIWANVHNCQFRASGLNIDNMTLEYNGKPTTKLGAGEQMETPTLPQVGLSPGIPVDACKYRLVLEYVARLPFYPKKIEKTWSVELRSLGGEFTWQFTMQ